MLMEYVIYRHPQAMPAEQFPLGESCICRCGVRCCYTYSVGFCVARSDSVGNAKALIRGTSNEHRLPRFSYKPILNQDLKTTLNPGSL